MARQWDPTKWDADQGKWGSAGLIWNGGRDPRSLTNGSSGEDWNFDPKYMRRKENYSSEGGNASYEPTEYFKKLLGGKVQVRDLKRLKDKNAVTDGGEEVGWLTDAANYEDDTDWVDKAFEYGGMALVGGVPALHAMGGLSGLGAAAESGGGIGGLDLVGAGPGAALEGGVGAAGSAGAAGAAGAGGLGEALGGLGIKDVARGGLGLAGVAGLAGGGEGGGSSGGASTDAQSIIDQMANANRVDHTTPLGSRKWSKGPDGRWSVADTMDPNEAANFAEVQGLNAGVTGMTRDRLAQLLANPQNKRGDDPLSFGMFNIGG